MKSRTCKICRKEYVRERGKSYIYYCSNECRSESKRRKSKTYCQTEAGKQVKRAAALRAQKDGRAAIWSHTWGTAGRRCKQQNERNRKIRIDVIAAYSNETNTCALCGYNKDLRALDLDHINGHGSQERKIKKGSMIYNELYRLNFPDKEKYRVLCRNCNWITYCERIRSSTTL